MIKRVLATVVLLGSIHAVSAQWNPNAGVVTSLSQNAAVITSSGGSASLAIDGDHNTTWQSGNPNAALPQGYIPRSDLNILLGAGSTTRFRASSSANGTNTTDGNIGNSSSVNVSGVKAWVSYDFPTPVTLRTVSVKCGVPALISIYAYHSASDSVLVGTLGSFDNFALKRFSPRLNSVVKLKLICNARFSIFEVAAMSILPTEYLIVDLLQSKRVGYIETRFWSDSVAQATSVWLSNDGTNWSLAGNLNPYAFSKVIVRPPSPVQARYVKILHSLPEEDYAKVNVWEVSVYDEFGPYGKFKAPRPHNLTVKEIIGTNGLWGWGHQMFSNSVPQGQGPTRFATMSSHGRNYHNMHWDVDDPDDIPNYANMPFGLALWWLDWDREYLAWNNSGLKVQASIQFSEWIPPTRMANWNNPYQAAYNYGYAFARHFGPTNGNGLVDVMEVGNEPWTYPASFYLTVLRGMLHGANAGDPALKIIPCALQAGNPGAEYADGGNWLGARLTASEAPYINGINVHHYSYTYDQNGMRIAVEPEHPESDMRGVVNDIAFRDANLPGKKIYLSEWGWDSDGAGEDCTFGECVSEHEQAVYAVRGAMMFMRLGIDRITWYFYGNQASGHLYSRSGLEGQPPAYTPKKGLASFQAFVNKLGTKHFLDTLREDTNAWIYLFGDSAGNPSHIVAWRPIEGDDNSTISINLTTTLRPDSAWTISGLSASGEPAAIPGYANGVMNLTVSSTPLVLKVTPEITNDYIWTGNFSTDWNHPLNWNTYNIPDQNSIVTIPTGRPNYPATYGSHIEVNTLTLNAGGRMTLVPGADLTVQSIVFNGGILDVTSVAGITPIIHVEGDFTFNSGNFNAGTGSVMFDGTSAQTISGTTSFHNLVMNNRSSVSISSPVIVKGVVSVMNGSTLFTNNHLTIESGGSLMHGHDTPNGQTGSVTGNITMKRRGTTHSQKFNYWSSPVQGANVNSLVTTPYYYDPSLAADMSELGLRRGWQNASGSMQTAVGYASRGAGTVVFSGTPNSAEISNPYSLTVKKNSGTSNDVPWNLVGNPFPSALDAFRFMQVNGPAGAGIITGALYFWDDDGTGGSGWNAVQDYAVWNGAGLVAGPNTGIIFNGNIASGQSFFVEKINDGAEQLLFNNSMRTTSNNAFFLQTPVNRLWLSITNPNNSYNETLLAFLPDATDSIDLLYDAKKLPGNAGISFYSLLNGGNYAIQSLSEMTAAKSIPLGFKTGVAGTHTISLKHIEGLDETVAVILEDKVLGIFTHLRNTPFYAFNSGLGEFNSRFELHFEPPVDLNITAEDCEGNPGVISIRHDGNWNWDYFLTDDSGDIIHAGSSLNGVIDIPVPTGTYTLELTDAYGYHVTKHIGVNALQPVDAAFTYHIARRELILGTEVFFDDVSSNASEVEWNFGDGTLSQNDLNPSHHYQHPGDFDVTLRAWNADCEDEKTITLHVTDAAGSAKTTGVELEGKDRIFVHVFNKIIYLHFEFEEKQRVNVQLQDLTGKFIYSKEMLTEGTAEIDSDNLPAAVYLLHFNTLQGSFNTKVLLTE